MSTGGEFVTYGIISLILTKNYYDKWLRYSAAFVQNRSNWSGLCCNWLLLLAAMLWMIFISSEVSLGSRPSLNLEINWSMSLFSSGSAWKALLFWKKAIRLVHSFLEESILYLNVRINFALNHQFILTNKKSHKYKTHLNLILRLDYYISL